MGAKVSGVCETGENVFGSFPAHFGPEEFSGFLRNARLARSAQFLKGIFTAPFL